MKGIVPYNDIHIALSKHGYVSTSVPNSLYVTASFALPFSSKRGVHKQHYNHKNKIDQNIISKSGTMRSSRPTML